MKKYIVILIAAFVVIGGTVAYFKMQKTSTNKITVGVHSWPGGGMVYIGDKMGFFKEEGVEIDIKKIENFDTKRASLISGQIDVDVASTLDQLLIYNETGFPAQVIGITDESDGGDGLVSSDSITDLQQLKGKTIAYAEASPSDFFLRYILKANNIDLKSVHFKPVADPQIAGNAIIARQVDAAVTYEPWLSQAGKEKGLHVLIDTKKYPTLIPGLLIINRDKVMGVNKEHYEKFLRAWFKSADYYYSHKEESQKIISEGMGMKIQDVRDILSVVDIQTKDLNKKLIDKTTPNNLFDLLSNINVFWKENGFINKDLNTESMVNTSLIQK
ncbi:NitT/TauT family transport system substrate-binding protein [Flexibacter flexilis DSM 6793]|uniref:NitT/TauT family transport system substrate-binding protein n=1 Tax=Flexibacter flexilis DSM 6793 TaxID=927664 RepID=A0A1I1N8C5_9BACT|nr:ABC transporter substrate-binding protein [Flexibacter flexilis]SFC93941.1 NitT/TauT family transport system substrate-binding protein [Flexibacter flexilis DSM 6793]